ncbi:MAG: SH3 domain-containing protein [Symploca sp. SIO3E6]|nr:SH3 domain-containing protein [Caldora sp. SIO3E6]
MRNIFRWQTPVALSVSLALAATTLSLTSTATNTAKSQNTQKPAPESTLSHNKDGHQSAQTSSKCRRVDTGSNNLYLNIRSSPKGPIVGRVNNGEQVTLKDSDRRAWVAISGPKEGFVFGKYLKACAQTPSPSPSPKPTPSPSPSPKPTPSTTTTPKPTPSTTTTPADKCRKVVTPRRNLNIRSTPGGSIIGSLANGTQVTIANITSNGWVKIAAPREGYVFGQYLKPCGQATTITQPSTTSKCRQIQSTSTISIRQSPSESATVVGTLNNGNQVTIVNRGANGWIPISKPVNGHIPAGFLILCP